MTPDQLTRLAHRLRTLADRLDTEGPAALQRARDWQPGPRPGDNHDTPPQPGDPDYTGPPDLDPTDIVPDHERTDRKLDRKSGELADKLHAALVKLTGLLDQALPAQENRIGTPADAAAAGYCRSCWRDGQQCRDVAKGQYRDYCWWCGLFKGEYRHEPPMWLLQRYHLHGKVSAADRARAGRQVHHGA